jgi:NAD-dependent dihydropyrimidine dehydrogenase PreA subunit
MALNPNDIYAENTPAPVTGFDEKTFTLAAPPTERRRVKIPPELRKQKPAYLFESSPLRRLFARLQQDPEFLRSTIQLLFVLLCIWIGFEFHLFVKWGMSGGEASYVERPPGVGGFLPISSLMGLLHWIYTGAMNSVHPSGVYIFIAIVGIGLLFKKAFCSWMCPIGTLSESLWMLGKKIFGRNAAVPRWLDYPLRSLKYLILGYFIWAIFGMSAQTLEAFLYSPYNRVADIKMYLFFADISRFALIVLLILIAGSIVIKNFWCRYLCPYGALLGSLSWLSPLKITRNKTTCIDCELCTRACPSAINVHTAVRVHSDECMACMSCVQACPVRDTLELRTAVTGTRVPPAVFAALTVGLFVAVTGLAMLTGHWKNDIQKDEYLRHFENIHRPLYDH